jgi:mono/diheme cytochrome c family protein
MDGFQIGRLRFAAACALLAMSLGGPALSQTLPSLNAAPPAGPDRSAGRMVFYKWCSDCHSTAEGPGSMALQRKYQGSLPAILEQRSSLPPAYVKVVVRHGISFMPSFRKTEISDAELALVADYLAHGQGRADQTTKRP